MGLADNEVSTSIYDRLDQSPASMSIAGNISEGMALSSAAVRVLNVTVYLSSQSAQACYV